MGKSFTTQQSRGPTAAGSFVASGRSKYLGEVWPDLLDRQAQNVGKSAGLIGTDPALAFFDQAQHPARYAHLLADVRAGEPAFPNVLFDVHGRTLHYVNFTSSENPHRVSGQRAALRAKPDGMMFRLKELRRVAKLTQEDMAERMGISVSLYNGLETGKRRMNADYIQSAADIFAIPPSELIEDEPVPVAVAGRVGAGASVPLVDAYEKGDGLFHVNAPPQLRRLARSVVAVEVEGDSMMPMYQPGEVLFYSRATHEGVLDDDIGRVCVVEDADGNAWVKLVKIGDQPGLFHLLSLNPTSESKHNQRITWAAKVIMSLPAELVERI